MFKEIMMLKLTCSYNKTKNNNNLNFCYISDIICKGFKTLHVILRNMQVTMKNA